MRISRRNFKLTCRDTIGWNGISELKNFCCVYLKFSYTEILDITIFHDNFTDEIFDVVERERKRKRERKERKKKRRRIRSK